MSMLSKEEDSPGWRRITDTCCKCQGGGCAIFPSTAVSLLLNLEAAQQGRSVLFSDEQKILFRGGKKGFVKNTKLNFYETLTKPRMKAT
jgi:hypothetical protein